MSLIGKQRITVPSGVDVTITDRQVKVKGPKGELEYTLLPMIDVLHEDSSLVVKRKDDSKEARAFHGMTRALINNMVIGVSKGFQKKLEIIGVGYRAQPSGKKLTLSLGYSHPIDFTVPEGVSVETDPENKNGLIVSGIDRQKVGETAAQIRKYRPPEPYKGKGIRYTDEHVVRKAGKAAAKAS